MGDTDTFEGWAILELMGHRRLAGHVSEATIGGASLLRIDIPAVDEDEPNEATQFYSPSALYCLTPCSEETARKVATMGRPSPVKQWELPPAPPRADDDEEDAGF